MAADVVFITGNENKAKHLARLIGFPIAHQKVELDEIQSLDLRIIAEHKVRQAYKAVGQPVLVEDVGLTIKGMGRLPGPFVKWFIEDIGLEGLCRLADAGGADRTAIAACCYGYFDGTHLKLFYSELEGTIADRPKGDDGFGWNPVFIPEGETRTLGELSEAEFSEHYLRIKPIRAVGDFLRGLAKD